MNQKQNKLLTFIISLIAKVEVVQKFEIPKRGVGNKPEQGEKGLE